MSTCIAAHTNPGCQFPGFINFTLEDDGTYTVHFRGDPQVHEDSFHICGFERNKGEPGRCTPGDEHCNNYCNMAPAKGPMQDSPKPCTQVIEGQTASFKMTAEAFVTLASSLSLGLRSV